MFFYFKPRAPNYCFHRRRMVSDTIYGKPVCRKVKGTKLASVPLLGRQYRRTGFDMRKSHPSSYTYSVKSDFVNGKVFEQRVLQIIFSSDNAMHIHYSGVVILMFVVITGPCIGDTAFLFIYNIAFLAAGSIKNYNPITD